MYLSGTSPEKKIESKITYDVNNKKTNLTFDLLNMLPWLQRICIASHVISDEKATFDLEFGENCEEYQSQVSEAWFKLSVILLHDRCHLDAHWGTREARERRELKNNYGFSFLVCLARCAENSNERLSNVSFAGYFSVGLTVYWC